MTSNTIQPKKVSIYTDGACSGNPGKGGIGIILIYKNLKKELSLGFLNTTNNRMELLACIVALETLKEKNLSIDIYTDSRYIVDTINKKWLQKWLSNNFNNGTIKNQDLWLRFNNHIQQHLIQFHWIKGHASNPFNNRCDQLAVNASQQKKLLPDVGYNPTSSIKINSSLHINSNNNNKIHYL